MTKVSGVLRMSLKAGLAAGALMLTSAGSAQAQFFGFRYDGGYGEPYSYWGRHYRPPVVLDELEPREIVSALEARGFSSISRPVYREDVAIVRAVNPAGRPVRLTIDIFSGRILDRESTGAASGEERRPQVVQRVPGQGPAVRETVPETRTPARAAPERRRRRSASRLCQGRRTPPSPPRAERIVRPERPPPAAKPPEAAVGTRQQPPPHRDRTARAAGRAGADRAQAGGAAHQQRSARTPGMKKAPVPGGFLVA